MSVKMSFTGWIYLVASSIATIPRQARTLFMKLGSKSGQWFCANQADSCWQCAKVLQRISPKLFICFRPRHNMQASFGLLGFATYKPKTGLHVVARPEADKPKNRFNDGKADPMGRFW